MGRARWEMGPGRGGGGEIQVSLILLQMVPARMPQVRELKDIQSNSQGGDLSIPVVCEIGGLERGRVQRVGTMP